MKISKTLNLLLASLFILSAATLHAEGDKGDKAAKMQAAAEKKAAAVIAKYDANGDGVLSQDELAQAIVDKAVSVRGEKKPDSEKKEKKPKPEGEPEHDME